jgi:hypothetical protein
MPGPTKNDKTSNTQNVESKTAAILVTKGKIDQYGVSAEMALNAKENAMAKSSTVDFTTNVNDTEKLETGRGLTAKLKGLSEDLGAAAAKLSGKAPVVAADAKAASQAPEPTKQAEEQVTSSGPKR